MTKHCLYTFGAHQIGPVQPCHPSSKSCPHIQEPSGSRKPAFCPLALRPIQHLTTNKPLQIIDPLIPLFQLGDNLWSPWLKLDQQMTFYSGRIRPKPGTPEFGKDPIVEGSAEINCEPLTGGLQIVGAAPGTLQGEPSVILLSNGELRVLRHMQTKDIEPTSTIGEFVYSQLNEAEVKAVESTGLRYGQDAICYITRTAVAGPIIVLTNGGQIFELPWKDMSSAKQYQGGHKSMNGRIAEICSGWDKTVARTRTGEVWFWKAGGDPVQVEIPTDEEVIGIRAGGRLGIALTNKGEAWAWALSRSDIAQEHKIVSGASAEYLPGVNGMVKASRLNLPAEVNIQTMSVGPSHVSVASNDGAWYAAGDGRYGQLGIGEKLFELEGNYMTERGDEYMTAFVALDASGIEPAEVVDVACGATVTWVVAVEKASR